MKLIKMYLKTSSLCVSLYICFCFALHFHSIIFIYFSSDWVLELFVFLVHTSVNKDKAFLKLCIWQAKTPNFLCILASEFLLRTLFHLRKASQQWQMSGKYWKYLNRNRSKEEGQSLEKLCQADKAIVCLQTCHQMTNTGTNMSTHTLITTKSFLHVPLSIPGFPGSSDNKKICLQRRRPEFISQVGKILLRRKWQPTPLFLPGKSHGQRSLEATVHGSKRVE